MYIDEDDSSDLSDDLSCINGLLNATVTVEDGEGSVVDRFFWSASSRSPSFHRSFRRLSGTQVHAGYMISAECVCLEPMTGEEPLGEIFSGERSLVGRYEIWRDGTSSTYRLFDGGDFLGVSVVGRRGRYEASYFDDYFTEVREWQDVVSYLAAHAPKADC